MKYDQSNIKQYILDNIKRLAGTAESGYSSSGRGAVVIDFSGSANEEQIIRYGTAEELSSFGFSDEQLYHLIAAYKPEREFVLAVLFNDEVRYFKPKAYPLAE